MALAALQSRSEHAVSLNPEKTGLSGGDRTPDPQLRRLLLYPTELRAEAKKAHRVSFFLDINGRGERIRTFDPLVPNQMRYQAALHPDEAGILAAQGIVFVSALQLSV